MKLNVNKYMLKAASSAARCFMGLRQSKGHTHARPYGMLALPMICALLMVVSCAIEPPLKLASRWNIEVKLGEIITDINVIWDIDANWRDNWWYGWDDKDVSLWGEIAYPEPSNFEGRFFYYGEDQSIDFWNTVDKETLYEKTFRRAFDFGYHDMLLWSNIDSDDGTQVLIVDEKDYANIIATTSRSRLTYKPAESRGADVYHNPEIFYYGSLNRFFISRDTLDYDYFDPVRNAWIKRLKADLNPAVYIYLVQVVIYNNRNRVTDITDDAAINNLADGMNINTGRTSNTPVNVSYNMRLKKGLPAREGKMADIFGSKFTTFGLCDMEPWVSSRQTVYDGSRAELRNHLSLSFKFSNASDSAYYFDITHQIQKQAHGGIITLEIDLDTLKMPPSSNMGGIFEPTIEPVDSIEHEFGM